MTVGEDKNDVENKTKQDKTKQKTNKQKTKNKTKKKNKTRKKHGFLTAAILFVIGKIIIT